MKRADIARALDRGDISPQDLIDVLNGWRPGRRGPKPNLMRQGRLLAASVLLSQHKGANQAREILLAKLGHTSMSALDRLLERAKMNWQPAPLFDPERLPDGKTRAAVMLHCRHRNHHDHTVTFALVVDDWSY